MRHLCGALIVVAVVASGRGASAHDFWIEPSSFRLPGAGPLNVALRVGEDFKGEPVRRDPAKIERFVAVGSAGEKAVVGRDGADPAGVVRLDTPGLYVIGYRSNRSAVLELGAEKFERYLHEEGLDEIIAERLRRDESQKPGREVYSRCAKSLVAIGDAADHGYERVLGFPLELVPEADPRQVASGAEIPVRVLFNDKPCPGILIAARNQNAAEQVTTARSDAQGRVRLRAERGGIWLITAVHMIRAPHGLDADWESFWASLTFQREQPAPDAPAR